MKDTIQTINQFKETIIFHAVVSAVFIVVFTVLLCILNKKARPKGSILGKVWLIVAVLLTITCMKLIELIPAFADIYTNAIEVVEISNCDRQHYAKSVSGLPRTEINFTTVDGEKMIGYFIENVETSDQSHGYILYAKYSHYILDCDLYE